MSEMILYQVYVIQNAGGKFYIGLSENVQIRLQQHNDGVSQWTRNRGPWRVVWTSHQQPLAEARKLEKRLKRQKGGAGFGFLTGLLEQQAQSVFFARLFQASQACLARNQGNRTKSGLTGSGGFSVDK